MKISWQLWVFTLVLFFVLGFLAGYFYSQSEIDTGTIKDGKIITHKTKWEKNPPNREPDKIELPDYIYKNYTFYKKSYNAPITINHALEKNWMYVDATDGYKSAAKEIELFSAYSHNWKITLGVGFTTFMLGACAYHIATN